MTATITKLPASSKVRKVKASAPRKPSAAAKKAARLQKIAMAGVGAVTLTLVALSLSHLTTGIQQVTGGSLTESALMAIGIDLGFVALEVAQIIKLPESTAKIVAQYANPAVIGTIFASALLNAFGFASGATGSMVYPAIALGCAIPALIYCLTRVTMALAK